MSHGFRHERHPSARVSHRALRPPESRIPDGPLAGALHFTVNSCCRHDDERALHTRGHNRTRVHIQWGTLSTSHFQIAKAFNSRSEPVDPPTLAASHIAALEYGPDSALAAATQAGTSLTSVAEAIDAYLTSGKWIAVSVRKPEPKERSRWNIWHDFHRPGAVSTHSRRSDAVIVSIYAGSHAPDRAQNALRQFHSALGGFELIPETQVLDGRDEHRPLWRIAGLSALVGGVATAGRYFWDSIEQTIGTPLASSIEPALMPAQLLGLGVAAVASAVAVLHEYGYLPSAAKQARALLEDGLAPAPAKRSRFAEEAEGRDHIAESRGRCCATGGDSQARRRLPVGGAIIHGRIRACRGGAAAGFERALRCRINGKP